MGKVRVLTPMRRPFVDARGQILNLLDLPIGSVSRITCKPGAVRANHYHKTDFHYCFLEKGQVDYYHRPVGEKKSPEHYKFKVGELFYTPPMYEHAMAFPKDSILWCFARNPRTMSDYESDTVRIPSLVPASNGTRKRKPASRRRK